MKKLLGIIALSLALLTSAAQAQFLMPGERARALAPSQNSDLWLARPHRFVDAATLNSAGGLTVLADAPSSIVSVDFSKGVNFSLTLTLSASNTRVLGNPTNAVAGRTGCFRITQSTNGTNLLTYASNWKFAAATAPSLTTTASGVDLLCYLVITPTFIYATLTKGLG